MTSHQHSEMDFFESMRTMLVNTERLDAGEDAPKNLCAADTPSQFARICEPEKNILLYFWQPSSSLRTMIENAMFSELPELSLVVGKQEILQAQGLDEAKLPCRILNELAQVISEFVKLLPSEQVRIEFCKTQGRTCPLFHVDRVSYRLLCTLRGPGTEWLADRGARRKGLGHGDNRKVVRQGALVYEVKAYQVCVLKGESNPGCYGRGVVHRSPAVPDTIAGRWYLRIDAAI